MQLQGLRVVDLSSIVLGPLASQILGDYGAEVIKVEPPEGDSTRGTGPSTEPGMAALFLGVNRNKKSVMLDLKSAEGRAGLEALLATADVLMHNIRPQKLVALGLEPERVLERHPRIVCASLNGFGSAGPYAGKPAYDDIIQGLSGSASLMQRMTGSPGYFPTIAADKTCAHVAVHAILAALIGRGLTGRGSHVEVPMFEAMVAFNLVEHHYGRHFRPAQSSAGYPRVLAAWRRPYRTSDGHVCLMPYTTAQWARFFTRTGASALASDARFSDMASRTKNIDALYEEAGKLIAQRPTGEWLAICLELEIPAAPVNQLDDLPDDPHLAAIKFFREIDDAGTGPVNFPGVPVSFDGKRPSIRMPPRLGEHTREVLEGLGLGAALLEALLHRSPRAPAPPLP
ncbi:MAG: CoA transferase [Pseudomonadota bacterium]